MAIQCHLQVVGIIMFIIVALNFVLPHRFHWKEELARLSLINRQIFIVHCMFIVLSVVLMGSLCLFFPQELLLPSPLARLILAGLTLFWTVRLLAQWFIYDKALWMHSRFNTVMHFVFTGVWVYFVIEFAIALWEQIVVP